MYLQSWFGNLPPKDIITLDEKKFDQIFDIPDDIYLKFHERLFPQYWFTVLITLCNFNVLPKGV